MQIGLDATCTQCLATIRRAQLFFRESFKSSFHVEDGLLTNRFAPLIIGQDFGRDPCSVITQMYARGRLLVLEEVIAEDIGLQGHLERNLRPALMKPCYMGLPHLNYW